MRKLCIASSEICIRNVSWRLAAVINRL
jgi:hypothetical protein